MKESNKPCLGHTSNHDRILTAMLIHKWKDHLDMQANYFNAEYHLHVQHSTNAQNIYATRNKILLRHKSKVLKDKCKSLNNMYYATKQRYKTQSTYN